MIFQLLGCNGGRITDWQPFRNSLVLEGYFIPHRVHPWQRKLRNNNSINRCTSWPNEGRIQIHFVLQTFPHNSIYLRFTLFASFFFRKSVERFISTFQKTRENSERSTKRSCIIFKNILKSI